MNFLDPRLPDRFWSKCAPVPFAGCWLARIRELGSDVLRLIGRVATSKVIDAATTS